MLRLSNLRSGRFTAILVSLFALGVFFIAPAVAADDIVDQYDHTILGTTEADGVTIYEIQSVPHEDAAVVWGREVLSIRDDHVVTEHRFYDQDGELVKVLTSLEIGEMGGRTIALRQRMGKVETPEEWTEIAVNPVEYELDLKDSLFTEGEIGGHHGDDHDH